MQKKKQGISLIVLVITIIVMIILAAAIIISLQNNGIINRASAAVEDSNLNEAKHIASLAWSEAYLDPQITTQAQYEAAVLGALQNSGIDLSKYDITVTTSGVTVALKQTASVGWIQNGLTITKGDVTLEAGDLIQYNAGVQGYSGKWKVLGAEDGNLLIMSTNDVDSLLLYGLEGGTDDENSDYYTTEYGLLNGISRLNAICEVYGEGTGAVGARSIKVEDVDRLTGYDKTTYGANQLHQYGNQVTFSWNTTTAGAVDYTSTNGQNGTLTHGNNNTPHTFNSGFTYVNFDTMQETTVLPNQSGLPTLTNSAYEYNIREILSNLSEKASDMIVGENENDDPEWDQFFSNVSYFLASPYTHIATNIYGLYGASFGLLYIDSSSVTGYGDILLQPLFSANGEELGFLEAYANPLGVRAVVKLSPNITIGTKDNTLGWSYTI